MESRQAKRQSQREESKRQGKKAAAPKRSKTKDGNYKYVEDLVSEGKDISVSEKRAIANNVKDLDVDLDIMADPIYSRIPTQNVALISFLTPFTTQECRSTQKQPKAELEAIFRKYRMKDHAIQRCWNIIHDELTMAIKVRGCFSTPEAAMAHMKQNVGQGDRVDPWVVDMYEYKMIPPNKYADKKRLETTYGDDKTNEFYQAYIKQQEQAKREKNQRVENFKTKMDQENKRRLENPTEEEEDKGQEIVRKLREFQKDSHFQDIVKTEVLAQVREAAEKSGMNLDAIIRQIAVNEKSDEGKVASGSDEGKVASSSGVASGSDEGEVASSSGVASSSDDEDGFHIVNPKTGRKVKKDSRLGKQLVKETLK